MTMPVDSLWTFSLPLLVTLGAIGLGYAAALRFRWRREATPFLLALALIAACQVSPLHRIGEEYLFSAHMLQHLLLILGAAPLLVVGLPPDLVERARQLPGGRRIETMLGDPRITFTAATVTLWTWHAPALFNLTLVSAPAHALEHLMLVATSVMFWWPVLSPRRESRLRPLALIGYLGAAVVSGTLLGIILTFAPPGIYPAYLHPADSLHLLATIRGRWGLVPAVDQQVGGLLMWVPVGLLYLGFMLAAFLRWAHEPQRNDADLAAAGTR